MNKINNDFKENIALLVKSKSSPEKNVASNLKTIEDSGLSEKINKHLSEINTLKAAETLLRDALDEKDNAIRTLMNEKDRHLNSINDLHLMNQGFTSQLNRCRNIVSDKVSLEKTAMDQKNEITRLNAGLSDINMKGSWRENYLDSQCHSYQMELRGKQDFINHLNETNKKLHEYFSDALKRQECTAPPVTAPSHSDERFLIP